MRTIKAIFVKQAHDILKNRMMLIPFIILPAMAFVMTEFVAKPSEEVADSVFVTMFAAMFVGMMPLMMMNSAIAEDREHKSLRFLVMAGVKPYEYLLGIGGFVLVMCFLAAVVFGLIGGFGGIELVKFIGILILGAMVSVVLGATIGIFSKNQQSATATATPVYLILALSPMISMFNETLAKVASVFYTLQVKMVVEDFSMSVTKPILIILANMVVFFVLFVLAYRKKGLRA